MQQHYRGSSSIYDFNSIRCRVACGQLPPVSSVIQSRSGDCRFNCVAFISIVASIASAAFHFNFHFSRSLFPFFPSWQMPASAYSMRYSCAAKHLHIHRIHQGWLKMHESREGARGEVTQRWRVARGAKTLLALLIWVCLAADATHRRHSRTHTHTRKHTERRAQTEIYFPRAADNVIRLGNRATTTTTTKRTITTVSEAEAGAGAVSLEVPLPTVWLSTPQTAPHGTHQTNTSLDRAVGRGAGQCVRSTWHKINNLSLRAAEMANLAPNTAEKHLRVAHGHGGSHNWNRRIETKLHQRRLCLFPVPKRTHFPLVANCSVECPTRNWCESQAEAHLLLPLRLWMLLVASLRSVPAILAPPSILGTVKLPLCFEKLLRKTRTFLPSFLFAFHNPQKRKANKTDFLLR